MKVTVRKDLRSKRTDKHRSNFKKGRKKVSSRKGAYAPGRKKAFKRMSNPLAENKQLLGSEISATIGVDVDGKVVLTDHSIPPIDQYGAPTGAGGHAMNTAHWHFNPDSALYQTQGLDESQMVGRSVYQTLTSAKFLIKWPQSTMDTGIDDGAGGHIMGIIPEQPMSYKMYWGTVPLKYLFTNETTPPVNGVSAFDLETLVNQRVTDYFNARNDRIQFIPKKTATINIEGSKVLNPQWGTTTGRLPVSQAGAIQKDYDGSIPDTLVKVTWQTNKKIHFEPTNLFGHRPADPSTTPPTAAQNIALANGETAFYRNYSGRIPFCVIVSWNHDKLPAEGTGYERTRRCPQVLVQDITYYRDS